MSARSHRAKHRAPARRFRLASMESLGFMDNPGSVSSWTSRESESATRAGISGVVTREDPFANWTPSDAGQGLVTSNVRWGFITGIIMIVAGLAGLGYWIYEQPSLAAENASTNLMAAAQSLQPTIDGVLTMDLTATGTIASGQLATIDTDSRALFDVAGVLPDEMSAERSIAADIAGEALEGSRILSDAYAYRSAVLPILQSPDFETDPNLIDLDTAAGAFGTWQSRFQGVANALPSGVLAPVGVQLMLLSSEVERFQTTYLDALRLDDGPAVGLVVDDLTSRLKVISDLLAAEFEKTSESARTHFEAASSSIDALVG